LYTFGIEPNSHRTERPLGGDFDGRLHRHAARPRGLKAQRDTARLDVPYDGIDSCGKHDIALAQIEDERVRRVGGDLTPHQRWARIELDEFLGRAGNERLELGRRIAQYERAVQRGNEPNAHQLQLWLLHVDNEPENERQKQRRALEEESFGESRN